MSYLDSVFDWKSWMTFAFAFVVSTAFVANTPAQEDPFPNELPGYEFFSKGKLKPVTFGTTKRSEVVKLFGNDCEKGCKYHDQFTIKFDYLSCEDCMTTTYVRDRAMCPLADFMDTIEKITLTPKNLVEFENVGASRFHVRTGGSIYWKDGSGGVSYETFGDKYGLRYSIKRGNTSTLTLSSPGPTVMHGPLFSIEYKINVDLETKIFAAPFSSCKKSGD